MFLTSRILRLSWAILFLWFGAQQLFHSSVWVGFLPQWTGYIPIPGEMLVQINGWLEIIGALFLISGTFIRPIALILALHLFMIAFDARGAIGMRDATLGMMGLALVFAPSDPWTIDALSKKNCSRFTL